MKGTARALDQNIRARIGCFPCQIAIKDLPVQSIAEHLILGFSGNRKTAFVRRNEPGFSDNRRNPFRIRIHELGKVCGYNALGTPYWSTDGRPFFNQQNRGTPDSGSLCRHGTCRSCAHYNNIIRFFHRTRKKRLECFKEMRQFKRQPRVRLKDCKHQFFHTQLIDLEI